MLPSYRQWSNSMHLLITTFGFINCFIKNPVVNRTDRYLSLVIKKNTDLRNQRHTSFSYRAHRRISLQEYHLAKTVISTFSGPDTMKNWNKILRIMVLLSIIFVLASVANSQMNRDSPFLGGKLPRTAEVSMVNKGPQPGSSFMISEPFNNQATSDLMISSDLQNTTCNQVSFLLTLTPSTSGSTGYQPVKVKVLENRIGTPEAVADLTLLMPVSGGSVHETIGFSSVAQAAGESITNEITVMADPDNEIKETNEGNNALTISGTCFGIRPE